MKSSPEPNASQPLRCARSLAIDAGPHGSRCPLEPKDGPPLRCARSLAIHAGPHGSQCLLAARLPIRAFLLSVSAVHPKGASVAKRLGRGASHGSRPPRCPRSFAVHSGRGRSPFPLRSRPRREILPRNPSPLSSGGQGGQGGEVRSPLERQGGEVRSPLERQGGAVRSPQCGAAQTPRSVAGPST
jgi:hypothetical protein